MNFKKPYLLEVWDEKYVFAPTDGSAPHWEEEMLVVLGAGTMEYEGKAYNISLSMDIYGEVNLSFSLDNYFYNSVTGEKEENYLAKYLFNEVKVKLKYDGEWYEFIIKNIQETHNTYLTCVYTCQQLASYELAKTGYNISFSLDDERGSAVQDAHSFMKEILADSEWAYAPAGEVGDNQGYTGETFASNLALDVVETAEEILYETDLGGKEFQVFQFTIEQGKLVEKSSQKQIVGKIFFPYSQLESTEDHLFAYIDDGLMEKTTHFAWTKLIRIETGARTNTKFTPTQWTIETPQKSAYSRYISYTDYSQPANSISQYCKQFVAEDGTIGYYRDITRNLDYGYKETEDPKPCKRAIAGSDIKKDLLGGKRVYFTYEGTDTEENLRYLYYVTVKNTNLGIDTTVKEGDTFDFYGYGAYDEEKQEYENYAVIKNGETLYNEQIILTKYSPTAEERIKIADEEIVLAGTPKIYYTKAYAADGALIYTQYSDLSAFAEDTTYYECILTSTDVQDLTNSVSTVRQYFTVEEDAKGITAINIIGYNNNLNASCYYTLDNENGTFYFDSKTGKYQKDYVENSDKYRQVEINSVYLYDKYRTLEASKSNCFNLTQSVAETFEVWCRYYIKHESNGKISVDPKTGRRLKWVSLVSDYGEPNQIGFTYGLNTQNLQRTIETTSLATKLYVEYCENSATTDGVISIQKASNNISRENFIFNFDYFIQMKLLDGAAVALDLYNPAPTLTSTDNLDQKIIDIQPYFLTNNSDDPGYLRLLGLINDRYDIIYDTILGTGETSLTNQYVQYKTMYDAYNVACLTSTMALSGTEEESLKSRRAQDRGKRDEYKMLMDKVQEQISTYTEYLDKLVARKKALNKAFEQKYQRFIQEGSWSDSNYIDHDAYYHDALKVSSDGAKPSISYTISAMDLSLLEGYDMFKFKVGDQTWVEDVDYFGYDNSGKPYHEEVVVKQIDYNLDDPTQTTITIANRSDKFEDLFQKLTATVNSYQINQQTYQRASNLTSNGALTYASLQSSLVGNKEVVLTDNDVITLDNLGLIVKNAANADDIVRIMSGGIVLSSDGGKSYSTGIYAGEINTALLKSGQINTDNLIVGSGESDESHLHLTKNYLEAIRINKDADTNEITSQMTIKISPEGMVLSQQKGKTAEDMLKFDQNGDLTLRGSIINGNDTLTEAPQYFIGIRDIKKREGCTVGPAFLKTTDVKNDGKTTYYQLTSGHMDTGINTANELNTELNDVYAAAQKNECYVFGNANYRKKTVYYKPTEDTTPDTAKNYYTDYAVNDIQFNIADYLEVNPKNYRLSPAISAGSSVQAFPNKDITYYEMTEADDGWYGVQYVLITTTTSVTTEETDDSKTAEPVYEIYKQYSFYEPIKTTDIFEANTTYYIKNTPKSDWRLLLGSDANTHNFGVDSNGNLYASEATFNGSIYADGGILSNVDVRSTCTIAAEGLTGTINDDTKIAYNNILNVSSSGATIGTKNKITVSSVGNVTVPYATGAGYAIMDGGGHNIAVAIDNLSTAVGALDGRVSTLESKGDK